MADNFNECDASATDVIARADAIAAQADATQALANAATAQADATMALLRAPVAGATYSVTAGALTVHTTFGGCVMSKSDVGRYFAGSALYPNAMGVIANHVPSLGIVGVAQYYLESDGIAYHVENSVFMDVAGAANPSTILFFER